jgi:hypothetical protein
MPRSDRRQPWLPFLKAVDEQLGGLTEVHCCGGFVIAILYGLPRATADVDIIEAQGSADLNALARIAGKGSELAKRHRLYFDVVRIADVPEHYADRLVDVFPREFKNLRLKAFEAHDLALSKLVRNADHDREDVKLLAVNPGLDVDMLRTRFAQELRPQLGNPEREDLTLDLWIEMIREVQELRDRRAPRPPSTRT